MTNSNESNCPKCGAPIPENAPQGLCPKCVLAGVETTAAGETLPKGRSQPPTLEELAPHFPDLEILERIGAGGMGAVYKARQPNLDRIVALKVLSHDLVGDPAFAERFGREARVLAKLSHPNIVGVFDSGTKGPYPYLLMEYVDGVNLRQAMRAGGFSPSEALTLIEDICSALKFAHEKGILHRDIKPENILIDSSGQVKIADFGIAKILGVDARDALTLTFDGSILGSPQYMAPEQIETPGDVDQRADIYSLGVVLYEMLTGELPLGRFALPSEKARLDARIDEIVLRTLEKERDRRYQTVSQVKTEVEAIHDPGDPTESETSFLLSQLHSASKLFFWCSMPVLFMLAADVFDILFDMADGSERVMHYAVAATILGTISAIFRGMHRAFARQKTSSWSAKPIPKTFLTVAMILLSLSALGVMVWVIVVMLRAHDGKESNPGIVASSETGGAAKTKAYQIAEDQPRVDLDLIVAPRLVATFELVETDAVGKERILDDHQGFILASDSKPWRGRVQLATIALSYDPLPSARPQMLSCIHSDSPNVLSLDSDGLRSFFDSEWEWKDTKPLQLELTAPGQRVFEVATRSDLSQTLSLRIEAQPRELPLVPAAALAHVILEKAVCGLGEDIKWMRYLLEEIQKNAEGAEELRTQREAEPEWLKGRPEKHATLTVPAGMVATLELEGAGDTVHHRAYIVASDLEPWQGKVRIGSLAGGDKMQWRIEGPINITKADIDKPAAWELKPDAYTKTLDKTTSLYVTVLGSIRSDNPLNSKEKLLTLDMRVERRKYKAAKAGLPEVLPVPVLGLGEDPDWIEGVKKAIEMAAQP